jgi:peptidoglycan/xylan/chitin deacetylase (PgdA/CDA1 family)
MKRLFLIFIIIAFFPLQGCMSITTAKPDFEIGEKEVILSFDDGPNAYMNTTSRLLDVLRKYNISAVFPLLGVNADQNPDLVRRIYEEGHLIVNHGYYDKLAIKMGKAEFTENLRKGEEAIFAILQEPVFPRFYRPHGGLFLKKHEKIWRNEGWKLLPACIRVYDAVQSSEKKSKILCSIIKKTEKQNGGIILLHDSKGSWFRMESILNKNQESSYNRSWLPEITEELIVILLEKGYQFILPIK